MFIEVIPLGGSIDDQWLTYFVRDELAPDIRVGCLVEVPFRNAVDYAVVTATESSEIPESSKSIVRIITDTPLLAPYQVRTIFDCSSHYLVHAHQILSLFLSKTLIRYLEKKDFVWLDKPSPSSFVQDKPDQKHDTSSIHFHHHADHASFFPSIREYATESTVIVFPDDFSLEAYLAHGPVDTENTLIVPDKLTETKRHKAFCSVYNGEKNIIIWTRRILYYNLSRYENILYIEDSLHKTAMRFGHSYQHLEILRKIALHSRFRISILSSLPSIESMYLLHTGVYRKL